MDEINWYFSDEHSSGNDLTDEFTDSKFSTEKWESFAREIIQNSIDAVDDDNKPVEIVFDLNKKLTIKDIPGCEYTKYVLDRSQKNATNPVTKKYYKKGLDILEERNIYCLKISDRNTKGVQTGRDSAWGALVFDTGKSVKFRAERSGSHGVGKKAPFIISCCNTVFYATKNKYEVEGNEVSDCLFQGKTQLITWIDNDKRKNKKGWFGKIVMSNDDENRIVPLSYKEAKDNGINEYFLRNDDYGTDVIIVGVNLYNENEEIIKKTLITSIISNFYVGILSNKIVINIFGERIDKDNFDKVFDKWVDAKDKNIDLRDYIEVFRNGITHTEKIKDSNKNEIGYIDLYFKADNTADKKNFWIFRSQGMKIESTRINLAEQPFTCIVHIQGKKLNDSLLNLENAAHDKFVIKDESMDIDQYDVDNLNTIKNIVKDYIIRETQIKDIESQNIEGLNEIINLSGSTFNIEKTKHKPVVKKNPAIKKGKEKKKEKKKIDPKGGHHKYPTEKKKEGKDVKKTGQGKYAYIYDNYDIDPVFIKQKGNIYSLRFKLNDDIEDCMITIRSINSDGKTDSSISEIIEKLNIDGKEYTYSNGSVKGINLEKGKLYDIKFKPKRDIVYQVNARIYCNKEGE